MLLKVFLKGNRFALTFVASHLQFLTNPKYGYQLPLCYSPGEMRSLS